MKLKSNRQLVRKVERLEALGAIEIEGFGALSRPESTFF